MIKSINDILRSVDHYVLTKSKESRQLIRNRCLLLYSEGRIDGRLALREELRKKAK